MKDEQVLASLQHLADALRLPKGWKEVPAEEMEAIGRKAAEEVSRTLKEARGKDLYRTEKGPNGRNLCRWCKKEVEGRRITFCSDVCVHEWRIRSSTSYARRCVKARDQGVCAACDRDTFALWKKLQDKVYDPRWLKLLHRLKLVQYASNRWRSGWRVRSLWQADHVVPVVEGGGLCGLENYRTLCLPCHKAVTRALRQRLKARTVI